VRCYGFSEYIVIPAPSDAFDYDSNLEIVSTQQQKIGLPSSGTLILNRPATRRRVAALPDRSDGTTAISFLFRSARSTRTGRENGLSRSEQKTVSTTQNNRLTGKAHTSSNPPLSPAASRANFQLRPLLDPGARPMAQRLCLRFAFHASSISNEMIAKLTAVPEVLVARRHLLHRAVGDCDTNAYADILAGRHCFSQLRCSSHRLCSTHRVWRLGQKNNCQHRARVAPKRQFGAARYFS
jgi:hypothetical protein